MPGSFNLELAPGHRVALDTLVSAEEELDMSRTADGTIVAGNFWGKLEIIHQGDDHRMEFTGSQRTDSLPDDFFFDNRIMNKLAVAARPTTARCNIYMYSPETQYSDIHLSFSPFWKMGITWPPAEVVSENKVKFFVRVHPGGAMEYITTTQVVSSLYYEAM